MTGVRGRMHIQRWWLLGSLLVGAFAAPAHAQDGDEAARLHFQAGRSHYDAGAYEAALREFEAAYRLSGRAALLYNLYLTTERMAQLGEAIDYLERYLAEGAPEDAQRSQLERRLALLRERRARMEEEAATSARPTPEGPVEEEPQQDGDLLPAVIAFGVAGAGLVSFAIFGGLALAEDGALAAGCGATRTCTDAEVSSLFAYDVAADVSWVTAAVAAATGAVLLVLFGLPSEPEGQATLAPWATPDSVGLASRVRF